MANIWLKIFSPYIEFFLTGKTGQIETKKQTPTILNKLVNLQVANSPQQINICNYAKSADMLQIKAKYQAEQLSTKSAPHCSECGNYLRYARGKKCELCVRWNRWTSAERRKSVVEKP